MMFIRKTSDRVKKIVVYVVAAAFVLSTGIIGIYALVDQRQGTPVASASEIAVVNGRSIDYWSFVENYYVIYQQYPFFSPGESEYWLRSYVLDQMIAGELLRAEAEKASIKIDKSEIDTVIETQKASFPSTDDYYSYLQSRGMTEADMREAVRSDLMVEAYVTKLQNTATVTDEEVNAEYEARKAEDDSLVFDEVKETIKSELLAEKKSELLITHINELRAAAKVDIKDPVINAINAAEAGDYGAAATYYRQAIKDSGTDPYLHMALGRVLEKLEDMDGALASFEKAAEVDGGTSPDIQYYLGAAYREREMNDKAAEAFRKASEIDGENDSYLHYILKSEFEDMGLTEDAEREQGIIDRIAEETARLQEEYARLLAGYEGSSETGTDESESSPSTQSEGGANGDSAEDTSLED